MEGGRRKTKEMGWKLPKEQAGMSHNPEQIGTLDSSRVACVICCLTHAECLERNSRRKSLPVSSIHYQTVINQRHGGPYPDTADCRLVLPLLRQPIAISFIGQDLRIVSTSRSTRREGA